MKNKKGFTLIELIAVIMILGIVVAMAVIGVSKYINRAKDSAYVTHEKNLKNATLNKITDCLANNECSLENGEEMQIYLSELIDEGYSYKLKDPKSDNYCSDKSYVSVKNTSSLGLDLDYEICLICDSYVTSKTCGTVYKDKEAPTCGTVEGGSTSWSGESITISVECNDEDSGCTKSKFYKTFSETVTTGKIEIQDKAGNKTSCPINAFVDKTAPTCTIKVDFEGESVNGWYSKDNVKVILDSTTDKESGIATYGMGTSFKVRNYNQETVATAYRGITTIFGYVKDRVGNEGYCYEEVKLDDTVPVINAEYGYTVYSKSFTTYLDSKTGSNISIKNIGRFTGISKVIVYFDNGVTNAKTELTVDGTKKINRTIGPSTTKIEYMFERGTYNGFNINLGNTNNVNKISRIEVIVSSIDGIYTNQDLSVYASATDTISGLDKYSFDGGVTWQENGFYRVSQNGDFDLLARDFAGNISNAIEVEVDVIDKKLPTCELIITSGELGKNGWYISPATIEFKVVDDVVTPIYAASGVNIYGMNIRGKTTDYATKSMIQSLDTLINGVTYVGNVLDNADNTGTCNLVVKKDTVAPVMMAITAGRSDYLVLPGAEKANVAVLVRDNNDTPGSSVETREYAWGTTDSPYEEYTQFNNSNATPTTCSGKACTSWRINEDYSGGVYYLWYRITDYAGNVTTGMGGPYEVKYGIVYDANGGVGAPATQGKSLGVDINLSTVVPTRVGYTFKGWATTNDATVKQYDPGDLYQQDRAIKLYAVWEAHKYTIVYNNNNGTGVMENTSCTYDIPCTLNANLFSRIGHSFDGWSLSSGEDYNQRTKTITSPAKNLSAKDGDIVTIYAIWKPDEYTVSYDSNNGNTAPATQIKQYGRTLKLTSEKATKTGYTFVNWNTNADGSGVTYTSGGNYTNNESLYLYAQWEANTYTIRFNRNGGLNGPDMDSITCSYDHDCELTSNTYGKQYADFQGWNRLSSLPTVEFADKAIVNNLTTIPNGIVDLYAVWKDWERYIVSYNANKGIGAPSEQTKIWSVPLTLSSEIPTRAGYDFLGWSEQTSGAVQYEAGAIYEENRAITFYAVWEARTDTPFKVYHYLQNADDNKYVLKREDKLKGTTDSTITIAEYANLGNTISNILYANDGGSLTEGGSKTLTTTINGNETTEIYIYYTRETFELKLEKNEHVKETYGSGVYRWGQNITIRAALNNYVGYNYTFDRWFSKNTSLISHLEGAEYINTTIEMPKGAITLKAEASRTPRKDTVYTIHHYLENTNDEDYIEFDTEEKIGTTDALIDIESLFKQNPNYVINRDKSTQSGITISPDGNTQVNLYYNRKKYDLTLLKGDNVKQTIGAGSYKWGSIVSIDAEINEEQGYSYNFSWVSNTEGFDNINSKSKDIVMGQFNITLTATATKKARTDTPIKFLIYFGNIDDEYPNGEPTIKEVKATTDSWYDLSPEKIYQIIRYDGYDYVGATTIKVKNASEVATNKIEKVQVKGTGDTTVYLYFNLKKYELTLDHDSGVVSTSGAGSYKWGQTYSINAVLKEEEGYTYKFSYWKSSSIFYENKKEQNATGKMPNVNITFTAITEKVPNTNTEYTVCHYLENINNDEYTRYDECIKKYGTTGDTITLANEKIDIPHATYSKGKLLPEGDGVTTTTISPSGNTIIYLYYSKNKYTLTLDKNEYIETIELSTGGTSGQFKYGQEVTTTATVKSINPEGYTLMWSHWESNNTTSVANQENISTTFTMGDGNTTLKAMASKIPNSGTAYTVYHMLENTDDDDFLLYGQPEKLTGTTDDTIILSDKAITIPNAKYGHGEVNNIQVDETNIRGDNKTEIYLYYLRNTVELTLQTGNYVCSVGINNSANSLCMGDINRDGLITSDDVNLLNSYLDDKVTLTEYQKSLADVDDNGTININDAERILEYTLDSTLFPLEGITNSITKAFKIGASVKIEAILPETVGYDISFSKWTKDGNVYSTQVNPTITIPSESMTLVANATRTPSTAKYTVYHMLENVDDTKYTKHHETEGSGITNSTLTLANLKDTTYSYMTYVSGSITDDGEPVTTTTILNDGSRIIYLYYARKTYSLTLEAGNFIDSVSGSGTYKYGKSVTISAVFDLSQGYTTEFVNWTSSDTNLIPNQGDTTTTITIPAANMTLTANATMRPNRYLVVYNANTGTKGIATGTMASTECYTNVDCTLRNKNYSLTGYSFNGWSSTSNGSLPYLANEATINRKALVDGETLNLYVVWKANEYEITLDKNGGTYAGTPAVYVKYGTGIYLDGDFTNLMTDSANPITLPKKSYEISYNDNGQGIEVPLPSSASATFNGYYSITPGLIQRIKGTGFINPTNFTNTSFTYNVTLYAFWSDVSITLPNITKTGYTCKWAEGSSGGTQYSGGTVKTISADTEYYAKCEVNTYTITLNRNSGSTQGTSEIYEDYGRGIYLNDGLTSLMTSSVNPITKPTMTYTITYDDNLQGALYVGSPTTSNAAFNGYYTSPGNGIQMITADGYINTTNFTNTTYTYDTMLYAQWTNQSITLPNITKTGHTCKWAEGSSGGTRYNGGILRPISNNMTYYAVCTANTYTINLIQTGATTNGTVAIYEKYGAGIYLNAGLTSQMTWSINPITKPTKKYTITYNANSQGATYTGSPTTTTASFYGYYTSGGTQMITGTGYINTTNFTNKSYAADATLTASWGYAAITLPNITKAGHICKWAYGSTTGQQFVGNTPIPISANTTFYAVCTANSYSITYDLGNESDKITNTNRETYNQGQSFDFTNPTHIASCHIFGGWYLDSGFKTAKTGITPTDSGNITVYAKWTHDNSKSSTRVVYPVYVDTKANVSNWKGYCNKNTGVCNDPGYWCSASESKPTKCVYGETDDTKQFMYHDTCPICGKEYTTLWCPAHAAKFDSSGSINCDASHLNGKTCEMQLTGVGGSGRPICDANRSTYSPDANTCIGKTLGWDCMNRNGSTTGCP